MVLVKSTREPSTERSLVRHTDGPHGVDFWLDEVAGYLETAESGCHYLWQVLSQGRDSAGRNNDAQEGGRT